LYSSQAPRSRRGVAAGCSSLGWEACRFGRWVMQSTAGETVLRLESVSGNDRVSRTESQDLEAYSGAGRAIGRGGCQQTGKARSERPERAGVQVLGYTTSDTGMRDDWALLVDWRRVKCPRKPCSVRDDEGGRTRKRSSERRGVVGRTAEGPGYGGKSHGVVRSVGVCCQSSTTTTTAAEATK
jgi:hypothetical protein